MRLRYTEAPDVKEAIEEIVRHLHFPHIALHSIYCYRSVGSRSKRIIARIHGLRRIWQAALKCPPTYLIEVISERYDKLDEEGRDKTLIHELLHIPKGFSGGFRPHRGYIDREQVERLYKVLREQRATTS
jgi:predicted metallopeptidase